MYFFGLMYIDLIFFIKYILALSCMFSCFTWQIGFDRSGFSLTTMIKAESSGELGLCTESNYK